jgi:hypothetical protein
VLAKYFLPNIADYSDCQNSFGSSQNLKNKESTQAIQFWISAATKDISWINAEDSDIPCMALNLQSTQDNIAKASV